MSNGDNPKALLQFMGAMVATGGDLVAEIEALKADNARLRENLAVECQTTARLAEQLAQTEDALEAERARVDVLNNALHFYADVTHYPHTVNNGLFDAHYDWKVVLADGGKRAREALYGKPAYDDTGEVKNGQ